MANDNLAESVHQSLGYEASAEEIAWIAALLQATAVLDAEFEPDDGVPAWQWAAVTPTRGAE